MEAKVIDLNEKETVSKVYGNYPQPIENHPDFPELNFKILELIKTMNKLEKESDLLSNMLDRDKRFNNNWDVVYNHVITFISNYNSNKLK